MRKLFPLNGKLADSLMCYRLPGSGTMEMGEADFEAMAFHAWRGSCARKRRDASSVVCAFGRDAECAAHFRSELLFLNVFFRGLFGRRRSRFHDMQFWLADGGIQYGPRNAVINLGRTIKVNRIAQGNR